MRVTRAAQANPSRFPARIAMATQILFACTCLSFFGCSNLPFQTDPREPAPVTESKPGHISVPGSRSLAAEPVAVVVSRRLSSFRELTDSLAARMVRPYQIFQVEDSSTDSLLKELREMKPASVVAIGRPALEIANRLTGADVIYAQVFNPPAGNRGVAPIPPFDMQLSYWQEIASPMESIGVLGSADMRDVIDALQNAAAQKRVQIIRREVASDKEALQAFRAMVPYIDGFVFLPDEAVLNPNIIRRIIVHGSRNDVQILAYSPFMFDLGAHLYISAEQNDVADQVIALLEEQDTQLRALTTMRVQTQPGILLDEAG